jgi:hypothetical protein
VSDSERNLLVRQMIMHMPTVAYDLHQVLVIWSEHMQVRVVPPDFLANCQLAYNNANRLDLFKAFRCSLAARGCTIGECMPP